MDQTNTQAGGNAQSLQPQAGQTQGSASPLQTGSGAGLSSSDSSNILNQGTAAGDLSVGVAGSSSRTSTGPPGNTASANTGIPGFFALIPLVLFLFALILAYRRIRKFDRQTPEENARPEEEMLEDLTWVTKAKNKKKKRKKPKKPHHH